MSKGVKMRRKLLGLVGIGTAAVLMLSGFDSAMTVEELQNNAMEAFKSVEQYSGDFNADADVVMAISQAGENGAQMTMPLQGNVSGHFAMTKEPIGAAIDMEFSGSGAGMEGSGSMELYLKENEDGTGISYFHGVMNGEDSGWQAGAVSAEDMAKAKEAMDKVMNGDVDSFLDENTSPDSDLNAEQIKELIGKYKETFGAAVQLSPEAAEVNGHECYEVVLDITGDVLTGAISDVAEVAGETLDDSTLAIVQMVASVLDIKVVADYDVETFLPVAGAVDLTGSDFSMLSQIAASMMGSDEIGGVDLTVNALGAQFNASYDDVDITIPDEALEAEVVDAGAALGSVVGGVTGTSSGGDSSLTADEATLNEDGSYHLEYSTFDGETLAADITVPEGMNMSYSGSSYIAFADEDYNNDVHYSLEAYSNADEALESSLSTSYMEGDENYSDIEVSDVAEVTLEDGTTVKYASISYKYSDTPIGSTYAAIPVGDDMSVLIQLSFHDDSYKLVQATEEDVVASAANVKIAG